MNFEVLGKDGFGRTNPAHGLVGNVYSIDGEVTELPAFDSLGDPVATIAVDNLNFESAEWKNKIGGKSEWFGVHLMGSLNVVEAGDYELCLTSDDGAQLYLDENPILDNDGVHEAKEVCEVLYVDAGEYDLQLLWFQAAQGPAALKLMWAKDGGEKVPIPLQAFFPPENQQAMARK